MPTAKLHEHLRIVTERLEVITVALLSDEPGTRTDLMAERRVLLTEVARTCNKLERPPMKSLLKTALGLSQNLRLVTKVGDTV